MTFRNTPGVKAYKKVKLAKIVTPKFLFERIVRKGWLVLDARDKRSRGLFGIIPHTFLITADYLNPKDNEFITSSMMKILNSPLNLKKVNKRAIPTIKNILDLKKINYIIFCNGYTCHRSTWAACKLREMGVPYEKVHLVLSGYSSLIEYKEN